MLRDEHYYAIEPDDSEDAEDEADEDDELVSVSGSHIAHSPTPAASSSNTRRAASTLQRGNNSGVGVSRISGYGPHTPFISPPSTQPGPAFGSTPENFDEMMRQRKESLAKLNIPGRGQQGQSSGNSRMNSSGNTSGTLSPNRETSAMPPPPNPSPSRDQAQSTVKKGKERASGFSATQPITSSSRSVLSSSVSTGAPSSDRPRIWTSISATATDLDKSKSQVGIPG